MTENIKVTGAVVTHNNVKYIERTVRTVLDNTKQYPFVLYAVDNASDDGTLQLLLKLADEYPQLKVVENKENIGFGAGHDSIINELDSDFHAVINPDIEIRDDVIARMVSYMSENKDIALLSPRICFPDGRDQILGKKDPKLKYLFASRLRNDEKPSKLLREYAMLDEDMTKPFDIENATGCFMLFRTKKFRAAGGFDQRYFMYFEDCDISRQMRTRGRVVYFPDAVIYHVWARDSKRNTKLKLIHIQSMIRYDLKWRNL